MVRMGHEEHLSSPTNTLQGPSVSVFYAEGIAEATGNTWQTGVNLTPGNCIPTRLFRIPQP